MLHVNSNVLEANKSLLLLVLLQWAISDSVIGDIGVDGEINKNSLTTCYYSWASFQASPESPVETSDILYMRRAKSESTHMDSRSWNTRQRSAPSQIYHQYDTGIIYHSRGSWFSQIINRQIASVAYYELSKTYCYMLSHFFPNDRFKVPKWAQTTLFMSELLLASWHWA